MGARGQTQVKICGVRRLVDLRACAELGVDAVGLNLWPGSRRFIDPTGAAELLDVWPEGPSGGPGPLRVAVCVAASPRELDARVDLARFDLLQPHGDNPVEPYAELAGQRGIGWIWVVRGTPALGRLRIPAPRPRWILLDAAVPGYGGAGRTTDWGWAAEAVEALAPIPVWLAGGIKPDNVEAALARVRPAGIDVASGAEAPGGPPAHKQREAIAALVRACRGPAGP